jgi:hypothetical protein
MKATNFYTGTTSAGKSHEHQRLLVLMASWTSSIMVLPLTGTRVDGAEDLSMGNVNMIRGWAFKMSKNEITLKKKLEYRNANQLDVAPAWSTFEWHYFG